MILSVDIAGIYFLFCPHPMPRTCSEPMHWLYITTVRQIMPLTFLYIAISLMLKGLKIFSHLNSSLILLLFHLKTLGRLPQELNQSKITSTRKFVKCQMGSTSWNLLQESTGKKKKDAFIHLPPSSANTSHKRNQVD